MENTARKTHPLILGAAVAVILASLAAIANFAGLLPAKSGPDSPSTVSAGPADTRDAAPVTAPAPVGKSPKTPPATQRQPGLPASAPAAANAIPAPPAGTPPPICRECGTVQAIRAVSTPGEGTGVGAVAGGALGGLLGHQIGKGSGNTVATIAGAVGGAVAGHQVEKQVRTEQRHEITVRFADGSSRSFMQDGAASWQVGDRVRLVNGGLQAD